jgi:hypothetical protein
MRKLFRAEGGLSNDLGRDRQARLSESSKKRLNFTFQKSGSLLTMILLFGEGLFPP